MNASSLALGPDLRPPQADAWGPGVAMALLAHALLIVALAWGVSWRSHETESLEAEVWSSVPVAEAPPPVVVPPPPPPPKAVPAEEPPQPETVPDLAIAKRKKEPPKEAPKPREREVFDSTPPKPRKADPTQPSAEAKAQLAQKEALEKAAREKAAQDKLARARAEQEAQAKEQARQAAEQAALEAQRQRILKDIVRNAGGGSPNANPSANGQAAVSSGASAAYAGRLRALFKRNLTWALDDPPGNPEVVVRVTVSPDGTILTRKVVQPSPVPAWDEAVLRAIDRTEVLPREENGRVQPVMLLSFKYRDY